MDFESFAPKEKMGFDDLLKGDRVAHKVRTGFDDLLYPTRAPKFVDETIGELVAEGVLKRSGDRFQVMRRTQR